MLISPPLPADEATEFLRGRPGLSGVVASAEAARRP
jgi:hypothetical protein